MNPWLSALLPELVKKAGEALCTELSFMGGIEKKRQKLHSLLLSISQVITDAEEQAYKKPAVKSWITHLKLAACDADDVLDELHYEALCSEALHSGHKTNSGVRGFCSPRYNPLLFKYKIGKRLHEVVELLGDLVLHMNQFGLIKDVPMPMDERMQTHSYVDEQDVIGREGDRKKIVHMLLGVKNEKMTIFSIVGMGGMGKTTLAQLIFNDAEIKNGFQKHMWVCVSEEFNVPDIVKKVIVSAVGSDSGLQNDNMEPLQQRLRKELSSKRYLLVLDDVWNKDVDKWDALRTLLGSCGVGSAIVVTTRDMEVASIMGTVEPFFLEQLGPEDSWTLFSRRAFGAGLLESPELVKIGQKIVDKCHGVPLAVKSMGALMRTKQQIRDWLNILESNTWNEENKILPALMVSYKHLPSYMKQCFAFCGVFPKDFEIDKLDLIHLWISNGFIPSKITSDLEAAGNAIFSQLVWRSFFQDVKIKASSEMNYGYRDVTTCKIHDLMHDLAVDISGNECFCLQTTYSLVNENHLALADIKHIQQDVHHLAFLSLHPHKISCVMQRCRIICSIFSLYKTPSCFAQNLNITNSTLRVLGLHIFSVKAFSFEPAFMKHLRYLDFSGSSIEAIPEVASALYNLQILVLNNCNNLKQLPEGMKYMVNLRHVYLDGCPNLMCMPAGLGQLTSLRTLTRHIVGTDPGQGIKELKSLKLGGRLHIYNLMKLNDSLDAMDVDLGTKHIEQLTFSWAPSEYADSQLHMAEGCTEVLEVLKPHHMVKVLNIMQYPGNQLPSWMSDSMTLGNLVELRLLDFVNCPNIDWCLLPCLEVLLLKGINNLRYFCTNTIAGEGCSNSPLIFPKLKFLSLDKMELLERWEETDAKEVSSVTFPLLDTMKIIDCPNLTAFPKVPVLKSLEVERNRVLIDVAGSLSNLSSLYLTACPRTSVVLSESESQDIKYNIFEGHYLPQGPLTELELREFGGLEQNCKEHRSDHLKKIESLCLNSCEFFIESGLWFWQRFSVLKYLEIVDCNSLAFWPEELQSMPLLTQLVIVECKNFTGQSPDPVSVNPRLLKLEDLEIHGCPNLVALPACLNSLETINITGCTKLEYMPGGYGALETLSCYDCPNLKCLPQFLPKLQTIILQNCNNITLLTGMHNFPALKTLCIEECLGIKDFPEGLQ